MPDRQLNEKTISYISDWQKRTNSQSKKYTVIMIFSMIVAFVICFIMFYIYRQVNYDRVVQINMKYIQDSSLQEANQIEARLNNGIEQIKKYADQYHFLEARTEMDTVEERLMVLCDQTNFDRIAYISLDGEDISLEGRCNVSHREYFQAAINGKAGYDFLVESQITKEPTLVFYAPIKDENDTIEGVLAGFFNRERMDTMFTYEVFNFTPNSYLLEGNGIAVANNNDQDISQNYFDRLSQKKFLGDVGYDEIQEVIADTERTTVTFRFSDNGKTVVGVISQFKQKDWMVLSILPYEITENMIIKANKAGRFLLFSVAVTLGILIAAFVIILKRRYSRLESEMTLTANNLKSTFLHDQKQSFIIESLGNTYSSVYFIDVSSAQYERISDNPEAMGHYPDRGLWHEAFDVYLEKFVDASHHERMIRFRDVDNLQKLIGENDNLSMEYQRCDKGWRKAFMIPAERDENGRITSVIFAVQKIEAEKKRELETQTALKEAFEAAQLASSAKTTFLSNMSHDIRTPMNAIVGMTAIAGANIQNPEKVMDCLKKITSSSKHLLGLINEVLDMSKIESGKVDLNEEEFSLSDLIDELISMNQSLIKEKDHSLFVRINHLVHENVIGDSTRLQQVFTNLLTNAIKYTPSGGKLEIIVTEKDTNKSTVGWYEVKFCDNGIGMSEEFSRSIFEPFSRANDERISTIQGTGLGMAIARNIIRMMNGDITVESAINKGSTFTVTFTLKLQTGADADHSQLVDLPVLVVDDDAAACESTCTILDSILMKSEWVTSGKEAVEKVVDHHDHNADYHAVLMDWKMPGMDGIETTKEIRRRVGNDLPIIVLTAYDWSEIEQEAREAGVNGFLSKPLFKSRLVNLFNGFFSEENEEKVVESCGKLTDEHFEGKRILLVEDNELNREIAVEILGMMGLEIDTAENGKIGYERFVDSAPGYYDLIFMDVQMPVMNGYEATAAIRSSAHPNARKIPIIAMTANAFSSDVRQAIDSGMNGHVSKPIEIANVVKTLQDHLR